MSRWLGAVVTAAVAAAVPALAQQSSTQQGAAGTGTTSQATKPEAKLQEALQKLHAGNQAEVKMAGTAQQSASSSDVKAFASRMIEDHRQNDRQLTELAPTLGVALDGKAFTKEQQQAQSDAKKLQGKTGAEFDRAYMKLMVSDHEKDVKDIGKAAKEAHRAKQNELATFLDQTHGTLQQHLAEARRVDKLVAHEGKAHASR